MYTRSNLQIAVAFIISFTFCQRANAEDRSYDGSGNNLTIGNDAWGATGSQLLRIGDANYDGDGASLVSGTNPRTISNSLGSETTVIASSKNLSGLFWQWGQFLDHDIDLTGQISESATILIPTGDPIFDPLSQGTAIIPFSRSDYDLSTGTSSLNPRQQINSVTSFIDASNVYGSSLDRANSLRSFTGGFLKTSSGNLLPFNTENTLGLPNANENPTVSSDDLFFAGDVRANEQVGLTAMHTLFMREHNRLAGEIAAGNPLWTDEQIYQRARKIVGAQMQVITFQEYLPALLGSNAPSTSSSYNNTVNPGIANEFSTALYRYGHSLIGTDICRVQDNGSDAAGGALDLATAFFNPSLLQSSPDEVGYVLKGLSTQVASELDLQMVDDLRNMLFGPPGAGGLDLFSLNVQRGRDHGLPDYNSAREAYGLTKVNSFAEITSDTTLQAALQSLYGDVDSIDLWVGALAEDHASDAAVGELMLTAFIEQFENLRDGDRFWYRNDPDFSATDILELESTTLAAIIERNTTMTTMPNQMMYAVPEPSVLALLCLGILVSFKLKIHRRKSSQS